MLTHYGPVSGSARKRRCTSQRLGTPGPKTFDFSTPQEEYGSMHTLPPTLAGVSIDQVCLAAETILE